MLTVEMDSSNPSVKFVLLRKTVCLVFVVWFCRCDILEKTWLEDKLGGDDVWFCQLQVKCLCVLMFLSFPLITTEIPGPCRHSITKEHLLTVRHLVGGATTPEFLYAVLEISPLLLLQMDNQLRSGCSITYTFIERQSLVSLEVPNKHFDSHFPRIVGRFELKSPVPAVPQSPEQMLLCKSCSSLDPGAPHHPFQVLPGFCQRRLCSVSEGAHPQYLLSKMCPSD